MNNKLDQNPSASLKFQYWNSTEYRVPGTNMTLYNLPQILLNVMRLEGVVK